MRKEIKSKRLLKTAVKGTIAVLIALAIVMAQIPGMDFGMKALADESDKTITGLGTGAIGNPTAPDGAGWHGSYVYYGKNPDDAPEKYRVLNNAETEFGGNTMLLHLDNWSESVKFNDSESKGNTWATSDICTWLNKKYLSRFSAPEKTAIAKSTKSSKSSTDGTPTTNTDTNGNSFIPLTGEKVFLLDVAEANNTSYGYPNNNDTSVARKMTENWWLRSRSGSENAAIVTGDGAESGLYVSNGSVAVRPAFNINLESILFTSLIQGTAGATGAEYKLTIKDDKMGIVQTAGQNVTRDGNVVTVPYTISGSNAGNANRVSVLLLNKEYVAGEEVETTANQYQKLNVDTWNTTGTGTFTLPDAYANKTLGTDYYAYIVAECVNGNKETDYASEPAPLFKISNLQKDSGKSSKSESTPAHEHSWQFGTITEPTEDSDGIEGEYCECGATRNTTVIPAAEYIINSKYQQIEAAKPGKDTILEMKGYHSLSQAFMKKLASRSDCSFIIRFTYEHKNYEVYIPAGTVFDISLDWYGPKKLMEMFEWKQLN